MFLAPVILAAFLSGGDLSDMLKFERERIGEVTYEAASACDVDQDGVLDIVSGEYWFEGPDFVKKHKICELRQEGDYYDDFSDYPMDVNGDGYPDIVSGGWWGQKVTWKENPKGGEGLWQEHDIAAVGNVERCCFYDVDGDGMVEIVPNTPGAAQQIFKLNLDENGKGAGSFTQYTVYNNASGHGLGFGDIDGDGRGEILLAAGWLKAPGDGLDGEWILNPYIDANSGEKIDFGSASVPVLPYDVNGNGLQDIIVGNGHGYGLWWFEHIAADDGSHKWRRHDIEPERSQFHEMQLADIDNDGELELVTGKRYRAHQGHDPGADDPIGLYYYKINGGNFERVTLDYGPAGEASGAGIYLWIADLDGNGWKDIVAPGKDGLYVFRNKGHVQG